MSRTLQNLVTPSVIDMLQADHEHVMTMFHDYRPDASARQRGTIARCVCVAIEVHSLLEEEIFYPALRAVTPDPQLLDHGEAEQRGVLMMIQELRGLDPSDPAHDTLFLRLMRAILHHVADEEAVLMPQARMLLRERLHELGATMARRRVELLAPRSGELLSNGIGSVPAAYGLFGGAAMAGVSMAFRHVFAR